jgi:serine/threonine protein kinase
MSDEISSTFDIVKPFLPPLIRDVAETLLKIKDLYDTAQHNNKTVELLIIRISKVDRIISILETSETIEKGTYSSLEDLNQVLREMRDYIEQITQSTTLLKFLKAKNSEVEFKKLCSKYDSIMISLNVSLSLNIVMNNKVDEEKESKVLNEDIKEALRFQSAIAESIKISNEKTELKIDRFFGEIRNIANVMKKLEGANQKKIDDIFNDSMLPFDDYKELDDEPRKEILRKYEHIKTQQEYAFKILNKSAKDLGAEVINKVKNQVTILKKLKDCHNIIRFFGLTFDESIGKYYLVTEWAEKRNLREYIEDKRSKGQNIETKLKIRFAYDIAKGLNFLSAVKVITSKSYECQIILLYLYLSFFL